MMKKSLILTILTVTIGLNSCVSTKVKVNTIYTNGLPIDTLNLVSTMIGPVWQPVLPLIDAAAFNEKTNKISDKILDEEQRMMENYKTILVRSLKERLRAIIVTGSEINSEDATKYKVQNGIQVNNKNFPIVFFTDGDMNFIDFGKGKNVNEIFKNNKELKTRITQFASELNFKTVLISYSRLSVISAGMFGITGNLRLESYLYLYKSDGNLLMEVYGLTKPTAIDGTALSQYKFQLDNFQELAQLMSQELMNYIK